MFLQNILCCMKLNMLSWLPHILCLGSCLKNYQTTKWVSINNNTSSNKWRQVFHEIIYIIPCHGEGFWNVLQKEHILWEKGASFIFREMFVNLWLSDKYSKFWRTNWILKFLIELSPVKLYRSPWFMTTGSILMINATALVLYIHSRMWQSELKDVY